MDEYESSNVVTFQDIEIINPVDEVYPQLSSFKDGYIEEIILELNKFFPRAGDQSKARLETIMFNPLNQQNWPDKPKSMKKFVPGSINKRTETKIDGVLGSEYERNSPINAFIFI